MVRTRDGDKHHVKSEPGGCQVSSGRKFLPKASENAKDDADHLIIQQETIFGHLLSLLMVIIVQQ